MKRLFALGSVLLTLATWLSFALLASPLSNAIAHRWGPQIVRAGDGKFSDAAVFLQHRFYEAALLLTSVADNSACSATDARMRGAACYIALATRKAGST